MLWGSLALLILISNFADEDEIQLISCKAISAKASNNDEIRISDDLYLEVQGPKLRQIRDLIGDSSELQLEQCRFDNSKAKIILPPAATGLVSMTVELGKESSFSNKVFDATTLGSARGSSSANFNFEITDSNGEAKTVHLFFRHRGRQVWEYFLLVRGDQLSNFDPELDQGGDESLVEDGMVILELGSLRFEANGDLATVHPYHPGDDTDDARFFKTYHEKEPAIPVKSGQIAYDPELQSGAIAWNNANSESDILLDFGQLAGSNAGTYEKDSKGFFVVGYAHDGRQKGD